MRLLSGLKNRNSYFGLRFFLNLYFIAPISVLKSTNGRRLYEGSF
jgi:hypothetical protein